MYCDRVEKTLKDFVKCLKWETQSVSLKDEQSLFVSYDAYRDNIYMYFYELGLCTV